eukprot:2802222-Pyramimonas_sp.AAC.1
MAVLRRQRPFCLLKSLARFALSLACFVLVVRVDVTRCRPSAASMPKSFTYFGVLTAMPFCFSCFT